jgi:hypothetical protein
MADRSHLDILGQGVEAWNEWRERNPSIMPDLSGADLSGAGANLFVAGANLFVAGADLSRADLSGAALAQAFLTRANLSGADLSGADLSRTDLTQKQIKEASGDEQTKLPNHLKRPADWSRSSNEQPNKDE